MSSSFVNNLEQGTSVSLSPSTATELDTKVWDIIATDGVPNTMHFTMNIPADACIGRWKCKAFANNVAKAATEIYIIANPFDPDGGCFYDGSYDGISKDDFLTEYVKNEDGCVWKGNDTSPLCKKWTFDQFRDPFLDCACDLLDRQSESSGLWYTLYLYYKYKYHQLHLLFRTTN